MERGRRSRRGRGHSRCRHNLSHLFTPPQHSKPCSFLKSVYNFFIMSSLIALIYLMLQYHCQKCTDKCDVNNISKSLDDIAKNLSIIKDSYYDLELKISRFSQELPKLEGQIDILEALANTMEKDHMEGWVPTAQRPIPNIDVYLNRQNPKNKTNICRTCAGASPKPVAVNQD